MRREEGRCRKRAPAAGFYAVTKWLFSLFCLRTSVPVTESPPGQPRTGPTPRAPTITVVCLFEIHPRIPEEERVLVPVIGFRVLPPASASPGLN